LKAGGGGPGGDWAQGIKQRAGTLKYLAQSIVMNNVEPLYLDL